MFLNIITNASQAIESFGEIAITTRLHDANHVAIRISDTGCGIPEENLSKIRDPFFTTKEVGTGTGLGLSIVDEIIRSHQGQLLVESQVGKGWCSPSCCRSRAGDGRPARQRSALRTRRTRCSRRRCSG